MSLPNTELQHSAVELTRLSLPKETTSRIQKELIQLLKDPHPAIDVYVNDNDMTFWKVIIEGPSSTPYEGGCWLAYLKFPENYPNTAPEIRFVTPILHCNINNYGRVCHSIFDRNYVPSTSVSVLLQCVYGLLLNPDVSDPLDSNLAMMFYDASGQYEGNIMKHVLEHAHDKSRSMWKKQLCK